MLTGIPTEPVAARVVECVKADELYIFTHPEMRVAVEGRFERIMAAFDSAEASPALSALPKREMPGLAVAPSAAT